MAEAARIQYPGKVEYAFLTGNPGTQSSSGSTEEWDSTYIPIDYAVDALLGVLMRAKAPVRMTALRGLLRLQDPRFNKTPGTPSARPRFISELLAQGVKRGLVNLVHATAADNNPVIHLTASGHARASQVFKGSLVAQTVSLPQAVGIQPTGPNVPTVHADISRSASDTYIDILRQANLGPFQEVRWAVYDEMDNIIRKGPIAFYSLIRDAVAVVRDTRQAELGAWSEAFSLVEGQGVRGNSAQSSSGTDQRRKRYTLRVGQGRPAS